MSKLKPQTTSLLNHESFPFLFSVTPVTERIKISQSQIPQKESTLNPVAPRKPLSIQSQILNSIENKLKNLYEVVQVHALLTTTGFLLFPPVANKLLFKYIRFNDLPDARLLFDKMPERDLVSWNVIIDGFAQDGDVFRCLKTFRELIKCGVQPDHTTLPPVIKACRPSMGFNVGRLIHCFVMKNGFISDHVVCRSLVDMYDKYGIIEDAKKLLAETPIREEISQSQIPQKDSTFNLITPRKPLSIQSETLICIVNQCKNLSQVKQAHALVTTSGRLLHPVIANRLLYKYIRFNDLPAACFMFDRMTKRDLGSWKFMIFGFVRHGDCFRCLETCRELIKCVRPDHKTWPFVIEACKRVMSFHVGRIIHCFVMKTGFNSDLLVCGRLVDMYAKFGIIDDAKKLFDEMPMKNLKTWKIMIRAFSKCRDVDELLVSYAQMKEQGISQK